MRLINAETLQIEEFIGDRSTSESNLPAYAILSHTWGEGEVSYKQFKHLTKNIRLSKGYKKIESSCRQARKFDLRYVWVDTCCIDKSSSAELSEAINSMFRYYANAAVCFAYLADVDSRDGNENSLRIQIRRSRWVTRGWTLQELIAPRTVCFFNKSWTRLGTKDSMDGLLQEVTGVDRLLLTHERPLANFSIACRMSWAAGRRTTRVEDLAYSLLGIFNINMPLLYGEGQKAFRRLQEEIMKESDDQSLFAWEPSPGHPSLWYNLSEGLGVLAEHPREFRLSEHFRAISTLSVPYSVTNRGIAIELPILSAGLDKPLALLACHGQHGSRADGMTKLRRLAIPLINKGNNVFMRDARKRLHITSSMVEIESAEERHIYLVR